MTLSNESLRVYNHIARAERFARGSKRRIDPLRRLARALLLDELTRYRHSFSFPRNSDFHGQQVPYFVDADGTRCAVAHLLEIGGQCELVRKIARERNHATVRELANESALLAWLEAAGLTVEEAARIQPSYCSRTNADECFCLGIHGQIQAVAEGTVIRQGSSPNYTDGVVQIERIDGDAGSLVVGQQYPASVHAEVGSRVVLEVGPPAIADAASSMFIREDPGFSLGDTTVTCKGTPFGEAHPIPKDVAYRALMASTSEQCSQVLAEANPDWAHSICDDSGCGCRFASPVSAAPATTFAIVAALLCYRSRRRLRALTLARSVTRASSAHE